MNEKEIQVGTDYSFFKFMQDEHGLILTGGQIQDILHEAAKVIEPKETEPKIDCQHKNIMWVNSEWKYFCLDCGQSKIQNN